MRPYLVILASTNDNNFPVVLIIVYSSLFMFSFQKEKKSKKLFSNAIQDLTFELIST